MAATGASPTLLQLRQLRGDPGLDRRQRHQAADRRHGPEPRRQARHQPVPRRLRAATSTTTRWNRSNVPDELKAQGVTHETVRPQQADLRLRLRHRRPDLQGQGVVLRLVLDPGRAAGAPRRRAGRSHAAEEPEREGQLAGDARRTCVSFLYLRRLQDQGRPQPRHQRHPVRRADGDVSTRTTPTTDYPLHGLWKIADDRTFGTNLFVSAKYALLQHRLHPRSDRRPRSAGRPQLRDRAVVRLGQPEPQRPSAEDRQRRRAVVPQRHGRRARHRSTASATARATRSRGTLWPGNGILANERAGNLQAQVFRQGYGGNRANYLNFYVGDTIDARAA